MFRGAKNDKTTILQRIRTGEIDAIALSVSSLVDDVILTMHRKGVLKCLLTGFPDKRAKNSFIPFDLVLALAIAAKMRVHTSLTNIPFALTSHETICELGYTMYNPGRKAGTGLMRESSLRHLLDMYSAEEFMNGYNQTVQNAIMPHLDIQPNIHILDCTKLEVNIDNENYEGSGIVKYDGQSYRGYKLATLRGLVGDTGIIEDIRLGPVNIHDLLFSTDMLLESPVLKPNDILIMDRGFLDRDLINKLKTKRQVDVYIPAQKNFELYKDAVRIAKQKRHWIAHPNKKRKTQRIAIVSGLGASWDSRKTKRKDDVDLNACVVWDTSDDEYRVFITTDTTKSAKHIIETYELRTSVEEDYRQIKDFWKIEDFKSTKLHMIYFHIVCTLLGYLFFQLYTTLQEGEEWSGKSFPVAIKNYFQKARSALVFYSGCIFGVLTIAEAMVIYATCDPAVQTALQEILKLL